MNLNQYIAEGEAAYLAPNGLKIDGFPSSPAYDAQLITAHVLYHTGRAPRDINTSRGHTYRVNVNGTERVMRITDYKDHRYGITGLDLNP